MWFPFLSIHRTFRWIVMKFLSTKQTKVWYLTTISDLMGPYVIHVPSKT